MKAAHSFKICLAYHFMIAWQNNKNLFAFKYKKSRRFSTEEEQVKQHLLVTPWLKVLGASTHHVAQSQGICLKFPHAGGKGRTGNRGQYLQMKSHVGCLELNNAVERRGYYKQDIFNMAAQIRAKKQMDCQMFSFNIFKESTVSSQPLAVVYVKARRKKNEKFVFLRKIPVLEHLTVREWELELKLSSMYRTNKPDPCKNTHRVSVLEKETETLLSPQEQQIRDTLNKRKQRTSVKRQVQWVMFWQDALEALLTRPLGGHTIFEPLIMFASQICI